MSDKPTPTASNMELWDKLRRVDPVHSKQFQRAGGFRGTAVKPSEQERLMTETFGPIGFGWGMTKPEYKEVPAGSEMLVYCTVGVWYRWNGERSDIFWGEGGDKIVVVRKSGDVSADDEARKKSLTDAIGNALKRIGMAADIHLGLWDDSKYREENEKFFVAKSNPGLQPTAIEKFEADVKEKLDAVVDLDALDDLWKSGINVRINEIGIVDRAAQNRIISAFSQKKNEILKRDEQGGAPPADPTAEPDNEAPEQPAVEDEDGQAEQQPEPQPAAKPKQAAANGSDTLTPELISQFEVWFKRKIQSINTVDELNPFWEEKCKPRVDQIEKLDEDAHRRIIAEYISCQRRVGGFKTLKQAGQGQNRAR